MAKADKTAVVDEIRSKLDGSDAAVLTEYRGLTVTELAELRGALRPAGAEYKVFKNTLARRAVEAAGLADLLPLLEGPTAFAFVNGDAVVAAKALKDFGRSNPALIVKGGLLGPKFLTPSEISQLADIEPRDVLLAKLAGGFQAPLVKAAGLFQAFTRNFAYGVKALIDQRVEGGEALPEPTPEAAEAPAADTPAPAAEAEAPAPNAEAPAAEAAPEAAPDAAAAPDTETTDTEATETATTEGD
jgi:large subunit ribosomal protein L10